MQNKFQILKNALLTAVEVESSEINTAAVLFSGGIDSALIAELVSRKISVRLYVVGLRNSNAIQASEKAASLLNLPLTKVVANKKELFSALKKVKKIIKTDNFLQLSIALPEYFALKQIKRDKFKHVFCGQGADELFFGYDEFKRLLEQKKSYKALELLREKKLENLFEDNLKRDFAIAKHFKLTLIAPYLNKDFANAALLFSAKENVFSKKDFLRKRILRKLAKEFIPEKIANVRKKAIQYDSAFAKELKKL